VLLRHIWAGLSEIRLFQLGKCSGCETMEQFLYPIEQIRPSQLFLNEAKLQRLEGLFNPLDWTNNDPLPIKKHQQQVFFTDGHTRAYLYHWSGITAIPVYWDCDETNLDLYLECLKWCEIEGIYHIEDFGQRIISTDDYERLWIERCREASARLSLQRKDNEES